MNTVAQPRHREIWVRLLLYPTHTLPTAVAPVLVAVGLAVHDGVFAPLPALLAFLGSWLIHVGGVFADNHELLRRHPDVDEHPELLAALADRTLELRTLRLATIVCFALGMAPAPYLYAIGGTPVLWIGAIGVLASVGYAAGPWPYARAGLAAPIFFVMFGVVAVVGTYYVQAAAVHGVPDFFGVWPVAIPNLVFVAGLPVGALITGVLLIDDIRDREFDAVKGWRTDVVRSGLAFARGLFTSLIVFAYLVPPVLVVWFGVSMWSALPLLTMPMTAGLVRAVRTLHTTAELRFATPRLAMVSAAYAMLLAIGLAVPTA